MKETKYLLIGGGLASMQAAKMLALRDSGASIVMVCAEPQLPYDRPPLSKDFLRGENAPDTLTYENETYFQDNGIRVLLGQSVVAINPAKRTAAIEDGSTIHYEKALIATGGDPVSLDLPNQDLCGIHYLRTVGDAQAIAANAGPGKRAVVIGGGFIGMELAASLTQTGTRVTVIEAAPHIWPRFLDAETAARIQDYCTRHYVRFRTGQTATELVGSERVTAVRITSGEKIACDQVCVGVGIQPRIALAKQAGLAVDDGIVVDEFLRTSHPDIYAGGDVVNFPDPVFGRRRVEHWGHAEYCGQVAGLNMAGAEQPYDLLSYVWSDIFDLHIEMAGNERDHDRVLMRGDLQSESFTVLYLKHDRLRAYLAVNGNRREYPKLQKLIRSRLNLANRDTELRDPAFELRDLVS
jgi:NADPH-dependent 2,4-dienoyl-CoA reductase/sulfur reductase-like enzyme